MKKKLLKMFDVKVQGQNKPEIDVNVLKGFYSLQNVTFEFWLPPHISTPTE